MEAITGAGSMPGSEDRATASPTDLSAGPGGQPHTLGREDGSSARGEEPSSFASLDGMGQNVSHSSASAQNVSQARNRRRRYARCRSRLQLGLLCGTSGSLRLLTLTQRPGHVGRSISRSFQLLLGRLRRRRLYVSYFRVLEYTRAGTPHLHIVMRGTYLAQRLISSWWGAIHGAPIIDVRRVGRGAGGLVSYLSKYLSKDAQSRYSWSWGWVYRGFARDWESWRRFHPEMRLSRLAPVYFLIAYGVLTLRDDPRKVGWEGAGEMVKARR